MSLPRSAPVEPESGTLDADKIADRIEATGMGSVAIVLLHAFRPLAWMGGQVALILQPLLDGPGGGKDTHLSRLASLLESDHGVDDLLERLDGRDVKRET